ncbi:hypothetical protein [Synechococcus sp. PCC 6312]|uniref:hypothetical protein n=1 Tax=Synechococcus sp. (strain ATCC 27167 / PCC 6312) TaxID=195253 RepID=UPI00029EF6C1|nr:hypothetical protein [Synechococcus sp. PCC 6312]AFY61816.1 hypothetical protein Syn6312_2735 [Synechococcus sp. PCC 6312]
MKRIPTALITMSVACLMFLPQVAQAYFHAAGGSVSHSDGSWSASTSRGGSASGGDGSWNATGYRGGTASGNDGTWHGTTASGTTAYGDHTYYGGTYSTYHPPTVVNSYYGSGCYNCGGWAAAGAAVGVATGAAISSAASANAYAAGAAAANAYAMGAIYPVLPTGCQAISTQSGTFYQCGTTWFSPAYGANGVYYRVVQAP